MNDLLIKNIYLPLLERLKGEKVSPLARSLGQNGTLDEQEGLRRQRESLHRILECALSIPYYRKVYEDLEITAELNDTYRKFLALPLLTKDDVRAHFQELVNPLFKGRVFRTRTSGSTGISLEILSTPEFDSWIYAGQRRARAWFGVAPGDRAVYLWGSPVHSQLQKRIGAFKARLKNILLVSGFDLTPETMAFQWEKIRRFRPAFFYGYASSVYELAAFLDREGTRSPLTLKAVFTTAETLMDWQRAVIERVFRCPVGQEYGCAEAGAFAYECPEGNYHLFPENVLVECLDNDGRPLQDGARGEIVLTTLHNFAMPLIRYRLGDVGRLIEGPCSCGRSLPLLDLHVAKVTDRITTGTGQVFSSELFDYINLALIQQGMTGISQFCVVQRAVDDFLLQVVKAEPFRNEAVEFFVRKMKDYLGDRIKVEVSFCSGIPRDPCGKLRYFRSEVNQRTADEKK